MKHASQIMKLPTLGNSRLYEKLKAGVVDAESLADPDSPPMFWLKYIKLLADLYQFLPSKKNSGGPASE